MRNQRKVLWSGPVFHVIGYRVIEYCTKTANLLKKTFIEVQNQIITKKYIIINETYEFVWSLYSGML